MWLAWSIPLMVLGVVIAVVPVLWGSVLNHHAERRESGGAVGAEERREPRPATMSMRVDCPLCEVPLYASSNAELVDRVGRHAWRTHGIPSTAHILESSLAS